MFLYHQLVLIFSDNNLLVSASVSSCSCCEYKYCSIVMRKYHSSLIFALSIPFVLLLYVDYHMHKCIAYTFAHKVMQILKQVFRSVGWIELSSLNEWHYIYFNIGSLRNCQKAWILIACIVFLLNQFSQYICPCLISTHC